ncbi:MAG: molecular chaperone HtpG [Gammaproteobacteria bacterium]|nr:molecular chaperone HtpG [Gammaproteobacteria bacterium]
MSKKVETLGFQTEVKQLLQLMIHSLYSNQDIFLRELISNASDALDKLRFLSLSDSSLYENDSTLQIKIRFDEKTHTLSIEDNGIGMNYDEVIQNLGTIAKSGTKNFIESLSGDQNKDLSLIGQFGVGFYSAFMVAEQVTVLTRKAGDSEHSAVKWESKGDGEFTIENTARSARGTEIILALRKESYNYLNALRLQSIIHQYSDHILFPILLQKEETTELEQINSTQAVWTKSKSDISEAEYREFYHHISHDHQDPLEWIHYRVEGKQDYTALLYIPSAKAPDLFNQDRKNGLKLFIERVFIMDNADLLPGYLRFIKGVIDSSDLPLNISREILQTNALSEKIKNGLTKKILQTLNSMATNSPEKYQTFWSEFGVVMKEGFTEDFQNQKDIAELLRFATTLQNESTQTSSLKDYTSRMKEGQEVIYYIIADQFITAQNSPHLEMFREQGLEVLLLSDRIDEWMMAYLTEFEGKKFQAITKGEVDLNKTPEESKAQEDESIEFDSLLKQMTEILKDQVVSVRLSKRLKDSPVCLVADEQGLSLHLQRLMSQAGQVLPESKPILEINPTHPLIKKLLIETNEGDVENWTQFLYGQALLAEGGQLKNPASFVKQINMLLLRI